MASDRSYPTPVSSEGESTWNTNTSYQTKVTLTFTPDANSTYLILATCLIQESSTSYQVKARLYNNTTSTTLIEQIYAPKDVTDYMHAGGAVYETFGASPVEQTYYLQYATSNTSGTARIKMARLFALKLISGDQFASQPGRTTYNTDTNYQTRASASFSGSGTYIIIASATIDGSSSTYDSRARVDVDGTVQYSPANVEAIASTNRIPYFFVRYVSLSSGSHNINLQYGTESTSNTVGISYAYVFALPIPGFHKVQWNAEESVEKSATSEASVTWTDTSAMRSVDSIVLFSALITSKSTNNSVYCGLHEYTDTDLGYGALEMKDTSNYHSALCSYFTTTPVINTQAYRCNLGGSGTGYANWIEFVTIQLKQYVVSIAGTAAGTSTCSGAVDKQPGLVSTMIGKSSLGADNRIVNPGFEDQAFGWIPTETGGATVAKSAVDKHSGNYSTRHYTAGSTGSTQEFQYVNVTGITKLTFWWYVPTGKVPTIAQVRVGVSDVWTYSSGSGSWTSAEQTITSTGSQYLMITTSLPATGEFFVDDLIISRITNLDLQPKLISTCAGTSDCDGVLTVEKAEMTLSGSIPATSTLSGIEDSQQKLISTCSVVSACNGILDRQPTLIGNTGTCAGTPSGILDRQPRLISTTGGTGTLTGGYLDNQPKLVSVPIAGTSTLSGIEDSQQKLISTCPGTSDLDGVLTGLYIIITGIIPGTSTLSGIEDSQQALSSSCAATSVLSGIEDSQQSLISVPIPALSSLSGIIDVQQGLMSSCDAVSTVTGGYLDNQPVLVSVPCAGTSTLDGVLTGLYLFISGSIDSVTTVAGIEDSQQALSTSCSAVSTVSMGYIDNQPKLVGTVPATSTLTGIEDSQQTLAVSITATGTVSGTLPVERIIISLIGGASSLSGSGSVTYSLISSTSGTSTCDAVLTILGQISISGTIAGTSTVTGSASVDRAIIGTSPAVSLLSGIEDSQQKLIVTSPGTSTCSAILSFERAIIGTIASTSVVSMGYVDNQPVLVGTFPGTSTLSGIEDSQQRLSVTIGGTSACDGISSVDRSIYSSCPSVSSLSGVLPVDFSISATSAATSSLTAVMELGVTIPISGVVSGYSGCFATLIIPIEIPIAGSISATSHITGAIGRLYYYPFKVVLRDNKSSVTIENWRG